MADSDGEYIDDISDDETNAHQVTRRGGGGTRSSRRRGRAQAGQPKARWEDIQRSWDNVVEGADGSISNTVVGLLEASKRKRLASERSLPSPPGLSIDRRARDPPLTSSGRLLKDSTPLQRGIIRHVILVLDLSLAMQEKDLRPTRHRLVIRYAQEFVTEFFEQNPISQMGVIGMRDGLAVRVSDMSGNPNDHLGPIEALRLQDPKGHPSLQNALEMARGALFHAPSHGTREVVMVLGALSTSDPGDVHQTINALVTDKIRVGAVGLAAQVAICREMVVKTNDGDDGEPMPLIPIDGPLATRTLIHVRGNSRLRRRPQRGARPGSTAGLYEPTHHAIRECFTLVAADDGLPLACRRDARLAVRLSLEADPRRVSLLPVHLQGLLLTGRMSRLRPHLDPVYPSG